MNALQKLAAKKKLTYMLKRASLIGTVGGALNPPKPPPVKQRQPTFRPPNLKRPHTQGVKPPKVPLTPGPVPGLVSGAGAYNK